ncbi:uncharacterized protein LOC103378953 isoform X3 [Cynoglossus semilaevis]|uniref:uncharacterized protein LOC103378953 isoform X3 n=1 Tax=Cynoglossus semilaevis TaxID=244447 RepID=UPI000D626167|nr:uncharacterized protein LOC103378953 isoform X3 [Cynoglossus semilaevis]
MSSTDSDQRRDRLTSVDDSQSSSSSSETSVDAEAVLQTGGSQQTLPVWSRKRAPTSSCDDACEGVDSESEVFSKKCLELQCYIQPLSSILQGLTSGRFSERLGSFQESLATDRIQRILGVLQKPDVSVSGPLPRIILIIAEMLQSWFPHIKPDLQQKQNHTPAKKTKQSEVCSAPPSPRAYLSFSSPHICSLKTTELVVGHPPSSSLPQAHHRQEVTQDNDVSSSTDSHTCSRQSLLSRARCSPRLRRRLQTNDRVTAVRTEAGESDVG